MADISQLMTEQVKEEKHDFAQLSERAVFFCAPKTLTEEQLKEVDTFVEQFLLHNKDGEGFFVYTLGFGDSCKIIEERVNRSKAVYKVEKVKWEDAKKGKKPLFDALNRAIRKSEIVFYIDDNLVSTSWLKNRVTEECVENRLHLVVKRLMNKGEEDLAFQKKRIEDLTQRIEEAKRSYYDENKPIITNEAYDKLKYTLSELLKQFPELVG